MGKRELITKNSEKDNEEYSLKVNKKMKNKKKLNINEIRQDNKQEKVKNVVNTKGSKQKSSKKKLLFNEYNLSSVSKQPSVDLRKSKKSVFVDNNKPQEVSSHSNIEDTKVKKKKQKFLNDDEAEVKEEDIDNFIDELTENDNSQYEEWIKLIEAKLHSKKT